MQTHDLVVLINVLALTLSTAVNVRDESVHFFARHINPYTYYSIVSCAMQNIKDLTEH
jgi:hypothetical protein